MTVTGLPVFDETVHLTNEWLNDLLDKVDWDDKQRAYRLLRATLHALRDHLPPELCVHLSAQLPMLVRGFYYEGWQLSGTLAKERTKAEFLSHIEEAFVRDPNEDTEALVRGVFALLEDRLSQGELEHVRHALPASIRHLWPSSAE